MLDVVSRQTEWDAAKADAAALSTADGQAGATGVVQTVLNDAVLLHDYWHQAAAALTGRLGRWLDAVNEDGAVGAPQPGWGPTWRGWDAELRVPSSWPYSMRWSLEETIASYLTQAILGRWYQTCGLSEQSAAALTAATGYADAAVEIINKRR